MLCSSNLDLSEDDAGSMLKSPSSPIGYMHKATIATLIVGLLGFVISAGAIYSGMQNQMDYFEEQGASGEFGEELWTGNTPARFEGELRPTSMYWVFIEETRDADVTLIGGDDENRFVPCDSREFDIDCDIGYQGDGVDYRLLGLIQIVDSKEWEVSFSGDVTGGSKVTIREISMLGDGFAIFGVGCFGSIASCLMVLVGVILAFTLKGTKASSNQVAYTSGSFVLEGQQEDPPNNN